MTEFNTNPFDFSDLSDMPEELAAKMQKSGSTQYLQLVDVIKAASEVGIKALTLNEVVVAATRMSVELPAEVTVRNWLNKAVNMGRLCKPSRQSYAMPGTVAEDDGDGEEEAVDATVEVATEAPATETATDPLADL